MDKYIEKNDVVCRLQKLLVEMELRLRRARELTANLENRQLDVPSKHFKSVSNFMPSDNQHRVVAYVNGRRLSEAEFSNLNKDEFDVVLNMIEGILKFRRNPRNKHSDLKPSLLQGFGRARFGFLAACLRRPNILITTNRLPVYPDDDELGSEDTLRQNICFARKALGTPGRNNPYIQTDHLLKGYRLNLQWQYLLISEDI